MKYQVIVQPTAADEIDAAFVFIAKHSSVANAEAWFNRLDDQIQTLSSFPNRCPSAPEIAYFAEEIRQLLVEPYRVLFTVAGKRVHVLHVRHMARRAISEPDPDPSE